MSTSKYEHVYFVGIGGIGMSALARYYNLKGVKVSGYDKTETALTRKLVDEGIDIIYEDNVAHAVADIDLVVYTPAVPENLAILQNLRSRGLPVVKRAKLLGLISEEGRCIAVSGTHGKTTTSSVVAHCLKASGVDISAFLGGILAGYETNYFLGNSDWVVVEADEFDRSFHHLHPEIAIINAMDADHLDIYGSQEAFTEAFFEFGMGMQHGGKLLVRDKALKYFSGQQLQLLQKNVDIISFGTDAACDVKIEVKDYLPGGKPVFDLMMADGSTWKGLQFTLPGIHNICNATAAAMAASFAGVEVEKIEKALSTFKGVKRRFERLYESEEMTLIDDYAHHPEEIMAICAAVKEAYRGKKILAIFQPHLYSRTKDFMAEFALALDGFEEVVLLDIYPAREAPIEGVTSKALAQRMKSRVSVMNKEELIAGLRDKKYEVLLTLGAGDIDTKHKELIELMIERSEHKG